MHNSIHVDIQKPKERAEIFRKVGIGAALGAPAVGLLSLLSMRGLSEEEIPVARDVTLLVSPQPRLESGQRSLPTTEHRSWLHRPQPLPEQITIENRFVRVIFEASVNPANKRWQVEGELHRRWDRCPDGPPRLWIPESVYGAGEVFLVLENAAGEQRRIKPFAGDGKPELLFIVPVDSDFQKIGVEYFHPGNARDVSSEAMEEALQLQLPVFPLAVVGEPFEFDLNVGGTQYASTDYLGQVLVLDHWAMYCLYCLTHVGPELKALQERYPAKVEVIAVNVDPSESIEQAVRYADQHYSDWHTIFVDDRSVHMELYARAISGTPNLGGVPFVVIVGPDGRTAYVGNFQDDEAKHVVSRLLESN